MGLPRRCSPRNDQDWGKTVVMQKFLKIVLPRSYWMKFFPKITNNE